MVVFQNEVIDIGSAPQKLFDAHICMVINSKSSEVQLGQTQVIGFVTGQLVQPYRDRPNEGTFSIYTKFSPMADPSFEPGRPGDSAIELGRIVDRGLRESRAVDTESLCANIAALAALSTFTRPECTFGGEDGQELIVHPPDEREPLPLIIHHFPVAVTFGFIGDDNIVVIDQTHYEEAVMYVLFKKLGVEESFRVLSFGGEDGQELIVRYSFYGFYRRNGISQISFGCSKRRIECKCCWCKWGSFEFLLTMVLL